MNIKDVEFQEQVGWVHVFLLLFTIAINLFVMVKVQVSEIYNRIRLKVL